MAKSAPWSSSDTRRARIQGNAIWHGAFRHCLAALLVFGVRLGSSKPRNRGLADVVAARHGPLWLSRRGTRRRLTPLMCRQLRLAPEFHAVRLRRRSPVRGALKDAVETRA